MDILVTHHMQLIALILLSSKQCTTERTGSNAVSQAQKTQALPPCFRVEGDNRFPAFAPSYLELYGSFLAVHSR